MGVYTEAGIRMSLVVSRVSVSQLPSEASLSLS